MRRRQSPALGPRMPFTRWFRVERWIRCAWGHDIPLGAWALWSGSVQKIAMCADCLEARGYRDLTPPGQREGAA